MSRREHLSKKDPRYVEPRSVEEVILRRKLEQMAISESKSMPLLPASEKSKGSFLPAIQNPNSLTVAKNSAGSVPQVRVLQQKQDPEKMYSESDVRTMMENVMKYCRTLQTRVQDLEVQVIKSSKGDGRPSSSSNRLQAEDPIVKLSNRISAIHSSLDASATGHPIRSKSQPMEINMASTKSGNGLEMETLINHELVSSLDSKIGALRDIFRQVDPLQERRMKAVKIQAVIRGYLARARKRNYHQGVREWRWVRCRPVIWVLDILLSNQSKLDSGFHLLKMNRTMKMLNTVYTKWAAVYRQNAPMRRAMRQAAEDRIRDKRYNFMLRHFSELKAVTVGSMSRKHANNERRMMIDQIRANMSRKLLLDGDLGVVPDSEVMRVLNRRVVEEFQVRKRTLTMQYKFKAMKKLVEMSRHFQKLSRNFRFRAIAGKCFYAWSDYIYLKSRGLDRKRWPGPRKYEVRYNQKRVDHFSKVRSQKLVFVAWKAYFGIQHRVKVLFQHKMAQHMQATFLAWKGVAKHQHSLRRRTYDNWVGYARLMTQTPFKAWADYVQGQKNVYHEHVRIAKAYRRWKLRQKLQQIVKVWRHQALFGRLDGLYTRQMLLKTLGEQKMFTSSLEKLMADQTLELDECKRLLQEEIDKRKNGESEITQLNATINRMKMTNHHYEQELIRLQSTVTSMALINPKQMMHMEDMQPEFRFRDRPIAVGGMEGEGVVPMMPDPVSETSAADAAGLESTTAVESTNSASSLPEKAPSTESKDSVDATENGDKPPVDNPPAAAATSASLVQGLMGTATPPVVSAPDPLASTATKEERDPDQLPGPDNTLPNQRLLERVKWVIERYKAANAILQDDAPEVFSSNQQASDWATSGSGDIVKEDSDGTAKKDSVDTAEEGKEGQVENNADEEEGEADDAPTQLPNEDYQASAPSTRGNGGVSFSVPSGSDGSSPPSPMHYGKTRSTSYLAIQQTMNSLPGLKLPSDPSVLSRSPSRSLLRSSNPFVKVNTGLGSPSFDLTNNAQNAGFSLRDSVSSPQVGGAPLFNDSPSSESHERSSSFAAGGSPSRHMRKTSMSPSVGGDMMMDPNMPYLTSPPQGLTRKMMGTSGRSKSFRASFSRMPSFSEGGVMSRGTPLSIPPTANSFMMPPQHPPLSAPGLAPEAHMMATGTYPAYDPAFFHGKSMEDMYYEDEELEDIVITWAKMLFTILEFLETGDITNLPMEDKRLWALHLLQKERFAKNTLSVEDQLLLNVDLSGMRGASTHILEGQGGGGGERPHSPTGRMSPVAIHDRVKSAIEQALITVDERIHGGLSWREALLKLRTMFPGAGNFSGFGVAIEETQETAFFQRLLKSRTELQRVEDIQTRRYQHNMLAEMMYQQQQQSLLNPPSALGAKKSFAEWRAEKAAAAEKADKADKAEAEAHYAAKSRPLGTDIYASNLKKLLEQDAVEREEELQRNSPDPRLVLTSKHHNDED